jgi:1,4-alpha-glucan branching enzyme
MPESAGGKRTVMPGPSLLTDHDIYLFKQGSHFRLQRKLGSHALTMANGEEGTCFAVWAPNAERVSVIGDFNGWDKESHPLTPRGDASGIWEGLVPGVSPGAAYKYHIASRYHGYRADKGDPFACRWECPPKTASIVWDLDYGWGDQEWLKDRWARNSLEAPWAIYELHPGSWRRETASSPTGKWPPTWFST